MSKFKVGDYVKCVEPSNELYGEVFEVTHTHDRLVNNMLYTMVNDRGGRIFVTEAGEQYFTLTPPLKYKVTVPTESNFTAPDILRKAEEIMRERGKQYDQQGGERSMEKIVNTFNAATGHNLTEAQGWMFMIFLKLVRDNSRTEGHQDSCEDLVAYSSLYGESRLS